MHFKNINKSDRRSIGNSYSYNYKRTPKTHIVICDIKFPMCRYGLTRKYFTINVEGNYLQKYIFIIFKK